MYTTAEAADRIGVSKSTLLRWIVEGSIADVARDWRGWRVWSEQDVNRAKAFKRTYHSQPIARLRRRASPKADYAKAAAESLARFDRALQKRVRRVAT